MLNKLRIRPLAGHCHLARLERRDVERLLLATATTQRDVNDGPRIELVGDDGWAFGLVIATGPGTVHDNGKRVEVGVRPGELVMFKSTAVSLPLPFRAKEVVTPLALALALPDALRNLPTCMMHEAMFEAIVENDLLRKLVEQWS